MKKIYFLIVFVVALVVGFFVIDLLDKKPVNLLVYGLESKRSDTIMLVMLNPAVKQVNIMHIPRDTYFPTEGKNGLGQSKLNATYGFKSGGGTEGLIAAVESLTGVQIDYFIEADYAAVEGVINTLGGVEIEVPFDMQYDDDRADPPLHINIKKGYQTIHGKDAIGYLRFRKSNDGTIREGDVQRIARQQQFIKAVADKTLSWKLPAVVMQVLKYLETDIDLITGAKLGLIAQSIEKDQVYFHILPANKTGRGEDGLSYYFHNKEKTYELIDAFRTGTLD